MEDARYILGEHLGSGQMGAVYHAVEEATRQEVAIKVLLPSGDPQRFENEIALMRRVDHPNLVGYRDDGVLPDGRRFLALEYLPDLMDLEEAQQGKPAEWVLARLGEVLQGLAYLHGLSPPIVHRDLKPANIAVDAKGQARILDLGLARGEGDQRLTQTGQTLGSLAYMAPEQLRDARDAGPRADLWAVGMMAREFLEGAHPLEGMAWAQAVSSILTGTLPAPAQPFGAERQAWVQRLLSLRVEDRFGSAQEALQALPLGTGEAPTAQAPSISSPTKPALVANPPRSTVSFPLSAWLLWPLLIWLALGSALESWSWKGFDWFNRRQSLVCPWPLVVVAIDDLSLQHLGRFPWPRSKLARILEHLAGARVIGVDLLLTESTSEDPILARVLAGMPQTVLGASAVLRRGPGLFQVEEVFAPSSAMSRAWGSLMVVRDADAIVRNYPAWVQGPKELIPSLALLMAQKASSSVKLSLDRHGCFLINYGKLDFEVLSAWDVWQKPQAVQGKLVVVMANFAGGSDILPTPLSPATPGGFVHVQALASLLSPTIPRRVPAGWEWLLATLMMTPLVRVVPQRLPLWLLGQSLLVAGLVCVLWQNHWFFSPIPALTASLSALVVHSLAGWIRSTRGQLLWRRAFERFVGKSYARQVEIGQLARKAEVTVLTVTAPGLAAVAEQASAEQLLALIQSWHVQITRGLESSEGELERLGDEVVVYWEGDGAALDLAQHLQQWLPVWQQQLLEAGFAPVSLAYGLASGSATLGPLGGGTLARFGLIGSPLRFSLQLARMAASGELLCDQPSPGRPAAEFQALLPVAIPGVRGRVDVYRWLELNHFSSSGT